MTGATIPSAELAAQIDLALAAHAAAYGTTIALLHPGSQAAAIPVGGGWATRTGPRLPINRAVGLGLRGPVDAMALDRVEAFYQSEGLRPEIELCPLADDSLHTLLRDRGYQYRHCLSVLVHSRGALPLAPDDVEISVVSPEQPGVWVHTMAGGFGATTQQPDDAPDILLPRSALMRPNVTGFLATIDDEPVGAGAMALGGGVAILFSASTLPAFRRRGVQSALIRARLAAAAGYDLVVVQTRPGSDSQRNLHRHGFQTVYTNVILGRP
jgi:ribosomal protein S18 acetylase RimI-like enzyme